MKLEKIFFKDKIYQMVRKESQEAVLSFLHVKRLTFHITSPVLKIEIYLKSLNLYWNSYLFNGISFTWLKKQEDIGEENIQIQNTHILIYQKD